MKTALLLIASLLAFAAASAQPQETPLLQAIESIRAIDDHAHPPRVIGVGERDDDYDALPCDPLEPAPAPAKIRSDNTQYIEAWKALYGYRYNDMEPEHVREVIQAKERLKRERGDQYPNWILDQLGIETELANRVAMGRGLTAPRFRWIPFADPLLVVRKNNTAIAYTPDRRIFYDREEKLLNRYMQALHVTQMPPTLNDYINTIVLPTLTAWKQQGAVAIKFEAAYLRQLSFDPTNENDAAQSYTRVIGGGNYAISDYKHVQDYLFRRIALEAGKLDFPVQIHTGGGCGSYFRLEGSNPSLLESVFNDFTLRHTKFVVLHAGWPFDRELAFLLTKPNVYADFSQVTWMLSGRELATTLRPWLEMYPEKVLFGTDLSPNTPEVDWEEIGWIASRDSRRALADVLNDLVHDGIITQQRALQYAQMVMHDNAARLYNLNGPPAAGSR